jgi:hypothetical protein
MKITDKKFFKGVLNSTQSSKINIFSVNLLIKRPFQKNWKKKILSKKTFILNLRPQTLKDLGNLNQGTWSNLSYVID